MGLLSFCAFAPSRYLAFKRVMAKEAKAESKAEAKNAMLAGKEYKDQIDDLTSTTALKLADLDDKAFALLDALHTKGKSTDAIAQLKTTFAEMSRDRISNWRGYSYTLLKKFDEETYKALKETDGRRRPRGDRKSERKDSDDRKDKEARAVEKKEKKEAKERGNFPVKSFDFNKDAPVFVPRPLNKDAPEFTPAKEEKDEKKEDEKKDEKKEEEKKP